MLRLEVEEEYVLGCNSVNWINQYAHYYQIPRGILAIYAEIIEFLWTYNIRDEQLRRKYWMLFFKALRIKQHIKNMWFIPYKYIFIFIYFLLQILHKYNALYFKKKRKKNPESDVV